jgi:hypothetical protein
MQIKFSPRVVSIFVCLISILNRPLVGQVQPSTRPVARMDAHGNPIRVSPRTGHISNYDEDKVGTYTLPDPLVLASGQAVRDAQTWFNLRRPEILDYYQDDIYGRVPLTAPQVTFEVASTDPKAMNGTAIRKQIVGHIGGANGPKMNITLLLPPNATGRVPVILAINFNFGGGGRGLGAVSTNSVPPTTRTIAARPAFGDTTPISEMLRRGYAYASIGYTDIQADAANRFTTGVQGLALVPGQTAPAPGEWGTITCWAWGMERVMDYLETDPSVDARRVAIVGHSRLGKTVLWAGALDPRIALVYSSCAGEMGSSLARRDYGETIDDMAQNFPWQFAGNFQRYVGHWNDMPVDTHMLMSLIAPRPLLITGGSTDQWSDPHGEFLGEVAAGPVYRLLGKTDLGTTELPALDQPVISGTLGFNYHKGGHMISATDWQAFFAFAQPYLKPMQAAAAGSH